MAAPSDSKTYGLLAEFTSTRDILHACEAVRDAGFTRWDAHTPFPVHGLDRAMGIKQTIIPWVVFGMGLTGAGLALLLQWWTSVVDYPLVISGKPLFSWQAFIPIIFEVMVLFSALGCLFGLLGFCRLPQYYHPLFRSERFERATDDRFFISIEAADPKFDADRTRQLLEGLGATSVELVED